MIIEENITIDFSIAGIVDRDDPATLANGVALVLENLAARIRERGSVEGMRDVHNGPGGERCGTMTLRIVSDSLKDVRP